MTQGVNTLFVTPYAKEEIDKEKSSGMIMGISPAHSAPQRCGVSPAASGIKTDDYPTRR